MARPFLPIPISLLSVDWSLKNIDIVRLTGESWHTVKTARHRLAPSEHKVKVRPLPDWLAGVDWNLADREIARLTGKTPNSIAHHRRSRGIPSPPQWCPTGERLDSIRERAKARIGIPLSPVVRARVAVSQRLRYKERPTSPELRAFRSECTRGQWERGERDRNQIISISGGKKRKGRALAMALNNVNWMLPNKVIAELHQLDYKTVLSARKRLWRPTETDLENFKACNLADISYKISIKTKGRPKPPGHIAALHQAHRESLAVKRLLSLIDLLQSSNSMNTNTNTQIAPDIQTKLDTAQSLFGTATENLVKAGAIIVDLVNNHHYSVDDIVAYYKTKAQIAGGQYHNAAPRYLIENLLKIGKKQLHPALLFSGMASRSALMALPFSEQERLLTDGNVEVVVVDAQGKDTGVVRVDLTVMPPSQVRQVFGKNEVRSAGAQRAWMVSQVNKGAIKAQSQKVATNGSPYRITNKGLFEVPAIGLTLSAADLLGILAQMETAKRK